MATLGPLWAEDSSTWEPVTSEARGKRAKWWLKAPAGKLWLRKEPRHLRPTEPAIGTFTLRLAAAAGLAAAESCVSTWVTTEREPKRGILVRRFLDDTSFESLSEGIRLIPPLLPGYDPSNKGQHTLELVERVVRDREQRLGVPLVQPFFDMLLFDAWIGNGIGRSSHLLEKRRWYPRSPVFWLRRHLVQLSREPFVETSIVGGAAEDRRLDQEVRVPNLAHGACPRSCLRVSHPRPDCSAAGRADAGSAHA